MISKNKVRLFSGISALAFGLSLCTGCNRLDKRLTEYPENTIYETLTPDAIESPTTKEEEKIPVSAGIIAVTFTDPATGKDRIIFMQSVDYWPAIMDRQTDPQEEEINFVKIKLGSTAIAPKIDEAYNKAWCTRYEGLSDPSIKLESQLTMSIIRDDNTTTDLGQYIKNTITIGSLSYDTVEMYIYTEGEEKENNISITYYDETGLPEPTDELIPIVTESLILHYGFYPSDSYTIEEYRDFEMTLNERLHNNKKKDL